jgi:hypothetical protein
VVPVVPVVTAEAYVDSIVCNFLRRRFGLREERRETKVSTTEPLRSRLPPTPTRSMEFDGI